MKKKKMPALVGALALLVGAPASAALYRCGNVFQDRPCDAPVQQEHARPAPGGGSTAPAGQPVTRPAASAPAAEAQPQAALAPASAPAREEAAGARPAASATTTAASARVRKGPPSLACGNLREQRSAIEARLRTGGRPQTVEMYQRQQREVERNLEDGNCL